MIYRQINHVKMFLTAPFPPLNLYKLYTTHSIYRTSGATALNAITTCGEPADLILLSRSSQRKAFRALKTSQPEELFRLAIDNVLIRPAEVRYVCVCVCVCLLLFIDIFAY